MRIPGRRYSPHPSTGNGRHKNKGHHRKFNGTLQKTPHRNGGQETTHGLFNYHTPNKIKQMIEAYNINEIHPNEANPRTIRDSKFEQLVKSIREFPDMTMVRPLIINQDNIILGGTMRYLAMKELEFETIPCQKVDWDEAKQQEFIIKDNLNFGEWDWDALANDFNADDLEDWGLELPKVIDEVEEEPTIDTQKITLEYTPDEYKQVKKALQKIASTPEQAVWKLLEL